MPKLEDIERELYGKEKEAAEDIERRIKWRMFFSPSRSRVSTIWTPEHNSAGDGEHPWIRHPWRYFFGGTFDYLNFVTGRKPIFHLRR
mgnify:CR=1 FL=1